MICFSIISFLFVIRMKDILRYLCANQLKPIAIEEVNAGVVVSGKLFNRKFRFDQYCGGDQAHVVVGVFDHVIDQLLSEPLVFINLKGIAVEATKKFFKLIKIHHVAVRVVELIEELEKVMQLFIAQVL